MSRSTAGPSSVARFALRVGAALCFVLAAPFAWQLFLWDAKHSAESARPTFFSIFTSWGLGRIPLVVVTLLLLGGGSTLWQMGARKDKPN